ncbi:MAG: hypothetical protein N4A33_05530 [Bacteriovoracaceae bacterium]|jgi:hypothetical protein|nr:hypothetical protein [Bacteriovoracaceae bacterium]
MKEIFNYQDKIASLSIYETDNGDFFVHPKGIIFPYLVKMICFLAKLTSFIIKPDRIISSISEL